MADLLFSKVSDVLVEDWARTYALSHIRDLSAASSDLLQYLLRRCRLGVSDEAGWVELELGSDEDRMIQVALDLRHLRSSIEDFGCGDELDEDDKAPLVALRNELQELVGCIDKKLSGPSPHDHPSPP